MTDLSRFMAAVRHVESGSPQGNYTQVSAPVGGYQGRGAYNISPHNWKLWTTDAGIPGANWRSPQAQDLVAASVLDRFFSRYGNWDLVAAAWFGGPQLADQLAAGGMINPNDIQDETISSYLQSISDAFTSAMTEPFAGLPTPVANVSYSGGGWIHPVAGYSEWSPGSWMPNTLTHRGRTHPAIDIYADTGTPIVSPVAGKVVGKGTGKIGGNFVRVQGDDGNLYYFAHMSGFGNVERGQRINAGAHLGFVGNTGSAKTTSPHLHMTIKRNGSYVNPTSYLNGATVGGGAFNADPDIGSTKGSNPFTMNQMLTSWITGLADQVAGGTRTDPRELISLEEPPPVEVEAEEPSMLQRAAQRLGVAPQ